MIQGYAQNLSHILLSTELAVCIQGYCHMVACAQSVNLTHRKDHLCGRKALSLYIQVVSWLGCTLPCQYVCQGWNTPRVFGIVVDVRPRVAALIRPAAAPHRYMRQATLHELRSRFQCVLISPTWQCLHQLWTGLACMTHCWMISHL